MGAPSLFGRVTNSAKRRQQVEPQQKRSPRVSREIHDDEVSPADLPSGIDGYTAMLKRSNSRRMLLSVLLEPNARDLAELNKAWDLHLLLFENLQETDQRPRVERYGDVLYLRLRSAHYVDAIEQIEMNDFHVLINGNAICVLCQDGRFVDGTKFSDITEEQQNKLFSRLMSKGGPRWSESLIKLGPEALLYRLVDAVVDSYEPVLDGIEIDKNQIERQIFSGDATAAERIYRLSQEVIDVVQSTTQLQKVLRNLSRGFEKYGIPEVLQSYLEDVRETLGQISAESAEFRHTLSEILQVNGTLVSQRQNEDMKKISGWAAILFAPTLIGAIYGMNFDIMPELHWAFGYPAALASMLLLAVGLWVVFKWRKWM